MRAKVLKYAAVGQISLRNHVAYVADFLLRTIFLVIIMYIFLQLWQTTYRGEGSGTIAGYSLEGILWYILFAESLAMAFPSLTTRVEEEVKSGDVAYRLTRPLSYIGYHYASYISEVAVRVLVNLAVGCTLGVAVFGWPEFGLGWAGFFLVGIGAVTVNFLMNMMLALCAFWVEETRGLEFVYHKLLFTVGGMLMPLELFPERLQEVCRWLPMQAVLYFPAKTAVDWQGVNLPSMLLIQLGWIVVLTVLVSILYGRGVRKLNMNGG
ncbi:MULTISPECIES: ABC transporter permease [Paenibacillus]|uniref:ABC transporter permease n=1 Tax=Paenibacillus TaxID=44249 RepID=UPI0022B8AE18|nr:ABC-2 family transporter protein [Paenibacillus caseinilyticus]MCZ8519233.1 ABC-2 family transporter protein [Paenibacillus caseinilyticus]